MTAELKPNTPITQENVGSLSWLRGLLEQKLEVACRADHADALFPMDERQAAAYHQTRADLLGWVLDMLPSDSPPLVHADANTDRPALSPPAEGEASDGCEASGRCTYVGSVCATPTPPSVDWERVGPKLVEALGELVAAMRRYEVDVDADAPYSHVEMMQRADAALAAAQPEGK